MEANKKKNRNPFSPYCSVNPVVVRLLRKLAMTDCNEKRELPLLITPEPFASNFTIRNLF